MSVGTGSLTFKPPALASRCCDASSGRPQRRCFPEKFDQDPVHRGPAPVPARTLTVANARRRRTTGEFDASRVRVVDGIPTAVARRPPLGVIATEAGETGDRHGCASPSRDAARWQGYAARSAPVRPAALGAIAAGSKPSSVLNAIAAAAVPPSECPVTAIRAGSIHHIAAIASGTPAYASRTASDNRLPSTYATTNPAAVATRVKPVKRSVAIAL